ncbi:MAG TPA: flagellar hook-basal body complex protein FliE [Dongiaceae bacterium]|nr:flagellar hook-basal body complex protein FliE [Dongiaceae bacterium]
MTTPVQMNSILERMREMQRLASQDVQPRETLVPAGETSQPFSNMFSQALNQVNAMQQNSSQLQEAYIRGDGNVDITRVMVASQKSSLAFQAVVQVRNKLVESYKEIMNMPV